MVLPIEPRAGWDEAKAFTASVATAMARRRPTAMSRRMSKRARRGRIFIDYLRNDRGSTAVGAYSTRGLAAGLRLDAARMGRAVRRMRADHFTVGNLRHRLDISAAIRGAISSRSSNASLPTRRYG